MIIIIMSVVKDMRSAKPPTQSQSLFWNLAQRIMVDDQSWKPFVGEGNGNWWAHPGIEPWTSQTLSETHTPRPSNQEAKELNRWSCPDAFHCSTASLHLKDFSANHPLPCSEFPIINGPIEFQISHNNQWQGELQVMMGLNPGWTLLPLPPHSNCMTEPLSKLWEILCSILYLDMIEEAPTWEEDSLHRQSWWLLFPIRGEWLWNTECSKKEELYHPCAELAHRLHHRDVWPVRGVWLIFPKTTGSDSVNRFEAATPFQCWDCLS